MPQDSDRATRAVTPEPFNARVSRNGDAAKLALSGEFDLATVEAARKGLAEAKENGAPQIVIDMSELTFIDSTGIAFLIATTKEDGERLRFIASEHKGVRRVLTVTGVDELFGGQDEMRDPGLEETAVFGEGEDAGEPDRQ